MKAGDLVYESENLPETRGELVEFLCAAIWSVLGPDDTDRLSNGEVADTLLRCLDVIATTPQQIENLQKFLEDPEEQP